MGKIILLFFLENIVSFLGVLELLYIVYSLHSLVYHGGLICYLILFVN